MPQIFTINGKPIKLNNGFLSLGSSSGTIITGGGSGGEGFATPASLSASFLALPLPTQGLGINCVGQVLATGGQGLYVFTLVQPSSITDVSYSITQQGVISVYNGNGSVSARTDALTVTVTDQAQGTATVTCNVVYSGTTGIGYQLPPIFFTSQNVSGGVTFVGVTAIGNGWDQSANISIGDASGYFSGDFSGVGYIKPNNVAWPSAGNYPLSITATENSQTIHANITCQVILDVGPTFINFVPSLALKSSRIAGTIVGQALADGSYETTYYTLSNNAGGKYSINALTGVLSVAGVLSVGTDTVTIVATRSGLTFSQSVSISVGTGVTLPSSNMTMTVSNSLTNMVNVNQTVVSVGQPIVTGITGTPVWSMDQTNRSLFDEQVLGNPTRYEINSTTGAVTSRVTLSAMTDALTISCTDGTNTCTQSFTVTPTAISGPTIYVGQGMSSAYPSVLTGNVQGFEHFAQLYTAMNTPNSPYQGATIYIESNPDQNYYANDNTEGTDLARFGLYGPATIIGVQGSINGSPSRPRMGGTVGSINTGVDNGGKGFIVTSGGDFIFRNLEITDVHANAYQGGSDPESNLTGCAIRQNGATFGNLTVDQCYIHDNDQGIQSGSTGIVTITNTELSNNGGEYVSSGATHNIYIGENAGIVLDNVLSWRTANGHCFKSRAYAGTITNSRFYDGERGSASCQIEIPNGGVYTISGSTFHKGTMPQNPNSVQFCAEMTMPINQASPNRI